MEQSLDDFSGLVGRFYEAFLDVAQWPAALDAACRFVGTPMGALSSYAVARRLYDAEVFSGYEARWVELYRRKYGAMNPLAGSVRGQAVGEIRCLSRAGLIGAFEGQPMYEEWVKPQRILDLAEVVLDASIDHVATLTFVSRTEDGPLADDSLRRIALLFPHVRRSVLIGRVLNMHRRSEAALSGVVEGLAAGVFVLGARGELLHANAAADALLSAGDLTEIVGGVLRLRDAGADRALREALCDAGSARLGGRGAGLPLTTRAGDSYVAHLLPLSAASAQDGLGAPGGRMALFVGATHPDLAPALDTLARTYQLTAAERRVARALAEIGSTPMIARALGVTVATVRTHLRSLFEKTGARRQVEVVSLLQGYVGPLA